MRMTKNMGLVMALTKVYVEYCCDTGCTTVRNQKKKTSKKKGSRHRISTTNSNGLSSPL